MGKNFYGEKYALLSGGALVVDRGAIGKVDNKNKVGSVASVDLGVTQQRYMAWGKDNCLPNRREALVADNNIVPALMMTRRNIILGRGVMAYKEELIDGVMTKVEVAMPLDVKKFMKRSQFTKYLATACKNDVFHSAIPTEFKRLKFDGKISRIRALECRHVRLGEQDKDGVVKNLVWKGNWSKSTQQSRAASAHAQRVELYDADRKQAKFATFEIDDLLCLDEYYPTPFWEGSEEWIELANLIPQFHKANLEHGYTMRWHIELPKGYFLDATAANSLPDDEKKAAYEAATVAKREFLNKLNEVLQGLQNAGKTIVTEYDLDASIGKDYPGIKITPLNYDMKDTALLKLFDASNAANMSAQGVHPTLANIQTQGKLSSGSEIRNAYLMYVAIHTPAARERLLRPLYIVKEENGWEEDIMFGFRDMLITGLDESKSGTKESNESVAV